MRRPIAICLVGLLCLMPSEVAAQRSIDDELQTGIGQFKEGELAQAILTFDGVIERLRPERAARSREFVRALTWKGAALVALAQEEPAKAAFKAALAEDKSLELDAREFSPRAIRVFEAARKGKSKSVLYAGGGLGAAAIIGGVVLAGGAAAAATLPAAGSVRFVSSNPPAGSTISLADLRALTMTFAVSCRSTSSSFVALQVDLLAGARAGEQNQQCVVLVGISQTFQSGNNITVTFAHRPENGACVPPATTTAVRASAIPGDVANACEFESGVFQASYTIVP